jgi:type I restriction enzyme S subunit
MSSAEVEPGYKMTEVGVIPEDWNIQSLKCIADPSKQWSFTGGPFGSNLKSSDYTSDGVRIIQLQNIGDGDFINDYEIFTSIKKANELLSCNIYPGDIILSKMGDPVARACIIPSFHDRYVMCSDGIRLAVDQKRFNTYFIYAAINSPTFRKQAECISSGSTRKRIGLTKLRNLILCCPGLVEQNTISTVLSDTELLVESIEQLIVKKRQIKQGVMQELLTGKRRLLGFSNDDTYQQTELGMIPVDWKVKPLNLIASVTSGKRLPRGFTLSEVQTSHPYIRVTDMMPGTVSLSDIKYVPTEIFPAIRQYRIFKEDIFISVAGTLGIVGKIPQELDGANLTENADRITNISCSQDYLLYILMSPLVQNVISSSQTIGAQPKLALARIRKFLIPLPPTTAEEDAIAVVFSNIDSEIAALEVKLSKLKQIKQGMMHNLLTGKIRLV